MYSDTGLQPIEAIGVESLVMPTVRKNESRSKYISRCIPVVMRESGTKSRAHAVAKCHGMWKQAQKQEQISNKELSNDTTGVENLSGGASETTPRHAKSDGSSVEGISGDGSTGRLGTIYPNTLYRSRGKTLNQQKRRRVVRFNPLRVDPTRTTTLRRIFQQALSARFRLLKGKLLRLIVDEDAFGLRKYNQVQSFNQEERSDEQQSNTSNSEIDAASREGGKAANEPSGSPGDEASGIGGGEGEASISQEDYVFLNQTLDKERSDAGEVNSDTGADVGNTGNDKYPDRSDWATEDDSGDARSASSKAGRESQLGVEGADNRDLVTNQRWAFHTNPEKVRQFNIWLQTQIQADILTVTAEQAENAYWTKYVEEGYRKGAGRAFDDVNVAKRAGSYGGSERLTGFYEGTREQFLQSSFGRPVAIEKVKLLTGRVFTELRGVTEAMATTITRELADGLVRGDNPRTIARRMIEQGIGTKTRGIQSRALTIARTETIRAHAEGQLDALEQMGVEKIGVMVEWSAAGDDRTCPKCLDLDGIVMKLKEARGIIPRHPNCRCSYIPANVGEATKGQIRGKADIQKAIDKSISRDLPKRTKRTLAEQKRRSRWAGADLKPSKVRPRDIAAEAGPVARRAKPSVIVPKKPKVIRPVGLQPDNTYRGTLYRGGDLRVDPGGTFGRGYYLTSEKTVAEAYAAPISAPVHTYEVKTGKLFIARNYDEVVGPVRKLHGPFADSKSAAEAITKYYRKKGYSGIAVSEHLQTSTDTVLLFSKPRSLKKLVEKVKPRAIVPKKPRVVKPMVRPRVAPSEEVSFSDLKPGFKAAQKVADELTRIVARVKFGARESELEAALLDQSNRKILLRTVSGKLEGAIAIDTEEGLAYIEHLGTLGNVRGSGTELLRKALEVAKAKEMELHWQSSKIAKGFYKKLGFKPHPKNPRWFRLSTKEVDEALKRLGRSGQSAPAAQKVKPSAIVPKKPRVVKPVTFGEPVVVVPKGKPIAKPTTKPKPKRLSQAVIQDFLTDQPQSIIELSDRLGVGPEKIINHLRKLEQKGLVIFQKGWLNTTKGGYTVDKLRVPVSGRGVSVARSSGRVGKVTTKKGVQGSEGTLATQEIDRVIDSKPGLSARVQDKVDIEVTDGSWQLTRPDGIRITAGGEYVEKAIAKGVPIVRVAGNNYPARARLVYGSHVVDRSLAGVVRHEFGHHVYREGLTASEKTLLTNMFSSSGWKKAAIEISDYAKTDSGELFAEAFSAYTHSEYKVGNLPRLVEQFLANILE